MCTNKLSQTHRNFCKFLRGASNLSDRFSSETAQNERLRHVKKFQSSHLLLLGILLSFDRSAERKYSTLSQETNTRKCWECRPYEFSALL